MEVPNNEGEALHRALGAYSGEWNPKGKSKNSKGQSTKGKSKGKGTGTRQRGLRFVTGSTRANAVTRSASSHMCATIAEGSQCAELQGRENIARHTGAHCWWQRECMQAAILALKRAGCSTFSLENPEEFSFIMVPEIVQTTSSGRGNRYGGQVHPYHDLTAAKVQ